jgi:nucleoid DNA-binding protein
MKKKPSSMSHRDWFVKQLANSLNMDVKIVDQVIKHQFDTTLAALQKNKTVEISGWGTFKWNDRAAQKRLDVLDEKIRSLRDMISNSDSDVKTEKWNDDIDYMLLRRKILMNKINELNTDLRGLEKQSASRRKTKGTD